MGNSTIYWDNKTATNRTIPADTGTYEPVKHTIFAKMAIFQDLPLVIFGALVPHEKHGRW